MINQRTKIKEKYKLKKTPEKGEGIFATEEIQENELVMLGVIEKSVDQNHSHASQVGEFKHVLHAGQISKVNHSCDPNCGIRVNDTGAHDFVARRTIDTDEEITFDYAMRNYSIDFFPTDCSCGASECRGSITGWKSLSEEIKESYSTFVAPYLLEMDNRVTTRVDSLQND